MKPDKLKTLLDNVTLTDNLVAGEDFDIQEFTEVTIYIRYTPGTSGDSIEYQLDFTSNGTDFHPEPDETVSAGVGTVITKSRTFLSTSSAEQLVPVLSMPVSDRQIRMKVKETAAAGFGTVTAIARASTLR